MFIKKSRRRFGSSMKDKNMKKREKLTVPVVPLSSNEEII